MHAHSIALSRRVAFLFTMAIAIPAVRAQSGAIAVWTLDEGQGPVAHDSTGNGNDGQLGAISPDTGTPSWVPGQPGMGHALFFSGLKRVRVPNRPQLEPRQVTLSAWINTVDADPYGVRYIAAKGAKDSFGASYALYIYGSTVSFYVSDGDHNFGSLGVPLSRVADGGWHHVAGSFDGSRVRFFLDGREVGPAVSHSGISIGYNAPLTSRDLNIGCYTGTKNFPFHGTIDQVALYGRPLGAMEIRRLAGLGPVTKDMNTLFRSLAGGASDEFDQAAAASDLAQLGDASAIEPIEVACFSDPNAGVRYAAAEALGVLGASLAAEPKALLRQFLGQCAARESHEGVRLAIEEKLPALGN